MTDSHKVEILLVDDSPSDVELTTHVLRHHNLANDIHIVEDGKEALDFIFRREEYAGRSAENPLRLVLLDLKLPKVDGLDVLKAIRANEDTRMTPVVILTSSKEQQDVIRGYNLGANAFVQKPVNFKQFQEAIKEIGLFWLLVNEPPPA